MFSPSNFMETGLTFKSLIHFELIFVYKIVIQIYSFTCGCPVFQHHLRDCIFLLFMHGFIAGLLPFYAPDHDSV